MTPNALRMPTLTGDKVTLRPWRGADVDVILEASQDPLIPLVTGVPTTRSTAEALAFIERQHGRVRDRSGYPFAIADRKDNAVGHIGLFFVAGERTRASVGYWIAGSHRRQGYANDALTTLTAWAVRHTDLDRIELYVEPWNEGSWRAAERAGFEREGLLRAWKRVGDEPRDMYMYSRVTNRSR